MACQRYGLLAAVVGSMLVSLPQPSVAAAASTIASTGPSAESQLSEIVVTAQKREENLQRIPTEVVAVSGRELATADINTAADLGKVVPGLIMAASGANPIIFVRGIGGAAANPLGDPGIAYNVDGVNFSRPQGATGAFFDVSRVEVLKGPQGTLYGRNTAGGAFNVISNDPVFRPQSSVGLEVGNYAEFSTNAMVNIPLNDEFAVRVAFKTLRHTGYLSLGYNDADDTAGRIKVLYQPNDDLAVKWTTSYFNKGGKGGGDVPISAVTGTYLNPANPWQQNLSTGLYPNLDTTVPADGHVGTKVFTTQLDVKWNVGFADLSITPAYVLDTHEGLQYDGGFYQNWNQYSRQYSLEARLASTAASAIKWVAGAYYLKEDEHFQVYQQLQAAGPGYYVERDSSPDVSARSSAVFGQVSYPVTQWLRATAGVRGTSDHKSDDATIAGGFLLPTQPLSAWGCPPFPFPNCPPLLSVGSKTWSSFNFKAGLDADITESSLVYANIATGTKPGGFDAGNFVGPFRPEKVTAYTVGSKNRFLENRLQVNAEAFYNDYTDLHANGFAFGNPPGFGPVPSNTIIAFETLNVPKSYTTGIDVSTEYLVTNNDRLSLNVEYLIGKFKNFVLPAFPPVGQVLTDYSGLVKDRAPKWSGNAGYDHTFPFGNDGKVVAGVHEAFSSAVYLTYQRTPIGALQPGYGLTDAQLTYSAADDKWNVGFHINNIANKGVLTDALATPGANPRGATPTSFWASPLPPRTYGLSFQYNMM